MLIRTRTLAALVVLIALVGPTHAAEFVVNTLTDTIDSNLDDGLCRDAAGFCSLRAAVQQANVEPDADTVVLTGGSYLLDRQGSEEDAAASGDLDILSALEITATASSTEIVGAHQDRIFDLFSGARLAVRGVDVRGGRALVAPTRTGAGARVAEGATLVLQQSNWRDHQSQLSGGAIALQGHLIGVEVRFIDNRSFNGDGGAIQMTGALARIHLQRCQLSTNRARRGGAVLLQNPSAVAVAFSEAALLQCSLDGNRATQDGGAVLSQDRVQLRLENSSLFSNTATFGGALFVDGQTQLRLHHVSIHGNHATQSGGGLDDARLAPALIEISASVLSGNTAVVSGPECRGAFRSLGAVAFGVSSGCNRQAGPGDLQVLHPQLTVSEPNNAFSPLLLPTPSSALLNAVPQSICLPVDQIGQQRPLFGPCDIGAVELPPDSLFINGFE